MNILTFLLFIPALIISFYLPGLVLLHLLKIKLTPGKHLFLAWITGTVTFLLLSYLLAYLHIPQLTWGILGFTMLYYYFTHLHNKNSRLAFRKEQTALLRSFLHDKILLAMIVLGSLTFLSLTYFSGYPIQEGIRFMGVNTVDGVVHLAYIKSQALIFPPVHPALSDVPLRGYHYFYDFLLSRFVVLFGFTAEDLYFRLFPLFISLLYGASIYFFARELTTDKIKLRIILFLAYFSQSTISFLLFFTNDIALLGISQPMILVFDPSVLVGITLLLAGMLLLIQKLTIRSALLLGIILGVIAQIKVYAGIIGIATLLLMTGYIMIKSKGKNILPYGIAIGTTGIVTYLTFGINNLGSGSLVLAPFLLYRSFMQEELVAQFHWEQKRQVFATDNNILRIALLYVQAVALFWLINLGSKLILLIKLPVLFKKSFWKDPASFLLVSSITVCVLMASFFIQSRSVFDIVQFLWIALILMAIPAGIIWGDIFHKNVFGKIATITTLVFFSIGGFWYIESIYYFSNDPLIVTNNEVAVYQYIMANVSPETTLVYLPKEHYHRRPIIAAMTGRPVYLESEITPVVPPGLIEKREKNLEALSHALALCDRGEIQSAMTAIGSSALITEEKNLCLSKAPFTNTKKESASLSFYQLTY